MRRDKHLKNAGRMRHRVQIQAGMRTKTASGGYTSSWTTEATVWAEVKPAFMLSTTKEFYMQSKILSQATHEVRMRYRTGITPDKRLVFNNRTLEILALHNVNEMNKELWIWCREVY